MGDQKLRVLIVDDHEVVRRGLRSFLDRRGRIVVVGEAGTVDEALTGVAKSRPDVVVMDVRLPDGNGAKACREIRSSYPETRVLMLTSYSDEEAVIASILAGASGYILKDTRGQDLVKAIETVGEGGTLLDLALARKAIESLRAEVDRKPANRLDALTGREARILDLLAEGKTNREIAQEVFLSEKTVKNYVSAILGKLNLDRRSQAAAYLHGQREPISH